MLKRLADSFSRTFLNPITNARRIQVGIFLVIVSPVAVIAGFAYVGTHHDLTEMTLSRRQSMAHLAAAVVEQRFDRLMDLGVSLATRVRFRQLVAEGAWDDAIAILKGVHDDFPFIERIFLADPVGTLMADSPALPEVRGRNFSDRDWFQGVSKKWKPYISNAYQRAAVPRYNVIAAAVPIHGPKGIAGILVLQIPLNRLLEWSEDIEAGSSSFIYLVDRSGRLATHPKDPSIGALIDYSAVSVTQKVLRSESGVELVFHPLHNEERIAAYAPVRRVGWGIIVQEPKQAAFKVRDQSLKALLARYGIIFVISCISASLVLHTFRGLKKAEAKIQSLNDDLQHRASDLETANKELEAFSYSVSHDLRAPLRAIDGFSQALLEDYSETLDREGKNYLQRLRAASQRMALLIDDLLNLSRVSRRQMSLETVDLSTLAEGILADFRQLEPDREMELRIAKGVIARADRRLMQIALQNLLQNAWKFTAKRERAKIEFGISQHNGRSAYFVRDNGAGFDMAYADKLFGAFQRLHGAHEFSGTGIGLATVQRIVHRHGGKIWAHGTVGGGATFYFTLGN